MTPSFGVMPNSARMSVMMFLYVSRPGAVSVKYSVMPAVYSALK